MDEKMKHLWDKVGGAAVLGLGALLPWALWGLGRGKRSGDPLEEALDRLRGHHDKQRRALDLAEWGYARAGRMLAITGDVHLSEGEREGVMRSALLYAACAIGVERSAADREAAASEAEDAWLREHGAEQPAWSRAWVFARSHLNEARADDELFAKLRAVFTEVESKLRPAADERLAAAEPASMWKSEEPAADTWHIDFKQGRPFGDLSEAERAAVLRSRETWRVGDVMRARWSCQPAVPPAPPASPAEKPPEP